MLKKRLKTVFTSAFLALFVILSSLTFADTAAAADTPPAPATGLTGATGKLKNIGDTVYGPNNAKPIEKVVGGIIQTGLTLIGVIFLVLTVYGGFIWMTARGEEAEAKRAKGILTMALIGLLVVVGAYAITAFVVGRLLVAGGLSA